jgi:hypothetical protein
MAQTLVPSYVLNADLYQKALNTSAELMISAKSEKVRFYISYNARAGYLSYC